MLRLFAGISLPPQERLRLSLVAGGLPGIRWIDPGNYHVTLRFIGEIGEDLAADIDEALARIRFTPFPLTILGIGAFGPPVKPRVVYAGVEASEPLYHLRERVEIVLARAGIVPEGGRYVPHVTLGYAQTGAGPQVARFIEANNLLRLDPFTVDRFELIRSTVTKSGSIYDAVAEYPARS